MSGLLSWSQSMQFSQAGDTSVTCLYAFITGTSHSQAMYEGPFRSLNSKCSQLGIQLDRSVIISDFEKALIGVVRNVFGTHIPSCCCSLHQSQCTWREWRDDCQRSAHQQRDGDMEQRFLQTDRTQVFVRPTGQPTERRSSGKRRTGGGGTRPAVHKASSSRNAMSSRTAQESLYGL